MQQPVITLDHVWKAYRLGHFRKPDLKTTMLTTVRSGFKKGEEFYALQDINLQILEGDTVGIIGPNGSGKTTLLKLLSRITHPTKGRIKIAGRLSAMLEVGIGFHPELTGMENIFLYGALMGVRKEQVRRQLDSIVSFSELENFLATPVKHYSSGMYVRLAFSTAVHLPSDILLLDEVLTFIDMDFKQRSLDKLSTLIDNGVTLLLVSHQLSMLSSMCTKGICLESGKLDFYGPIDEAIATYIKHHSQLSTIPIKDRTDRKGSGAIRITDIRVLDERGNRLPKIEAGDPVKIEMDVESNGGAWSNIESVLEFCDSSGDIVFSAGNAFSGHFIQDLKGRKTLTCMIPKFPLNSQLYHINASVHASQVLMDEINRAVVFEVVPGPFYASGKLPAVSKGMLVEYRWS